MSAALAQKEDVRQNADIPVQDIEIWLDGLLPFAIRQAKIAGAVVVVVDRDGIVLQKGYGFADWEASAPVLPDETLFRPGSISKLFTATAVMQQVEQGKLDLDADINTYLDFSIPPFEGQPVTMRQLLTHTPGFEEALRYLFTDEPMALEEYVKRSLPARVFAPGTTPAYSNYGSALAGYVVERVSGMPFEIYIAQNIFAPLGMTRSTFAQPLPNELVPAMSGRYATVGQFSLPFEFIPASPAGGLSATGADMGRFMIAHLNEGRGVLRAETTQAMQTYQAPGIDGLSRMALGFYEKRVQGRRAIGHGGDTQGFHSDLTIFPDDGVGLYVSLNSSGAGGQTFGIRHHLLTGFAERFLPSTDAEDIQSGVDATTAQSHAELVAGSYVSSRGSFTNFLSLAGFLGQAQVGALPDGGLHFPMLDGLGIGAFDWVEIAPFVWEDHNTGHWIAAEVIDGKVVRLSTDLFSPFTVLMPVGPMRDAALWLPVIAAALLIIFMQALLWPVRRLIRARLGGALSLEGGHLMAYRATGILSWGVVLNVLGWVIFVVLVSANPTLLGGGLDGLLQTLRLALPLAAIGLAIAAGAHLIWSFGQRRSWLAHLGRLSLFLSAILLIFLIASHHLYGFDLRF
ncbi:MAG: serine hydrolase domain-containing protein [Pseudomonadota bacterium]